MLVLAPTRELASQIAQSFRDLSDGLALKIAVVFGGVPHGAQIRTLSQGLDVLVATPGRLIDHLDARVATLNAVEYFVLDEVDQMLDLGFIRPIRRIARELPRKRQNLFFSATMPADIRDLAGELLHNPAEVAVTPVAKTADRVEQRIIFIEAARKRDMLVELFADPEMSRTLVFTRTKRGADRVAPASRKLASRRRRSTATRARVSASGRSPAFVRGGRGSWSRPTSPRAASTSTTLRMSSISSCRKFPKPTSTASAAPRAPARRARRSRFATARNAICCAQSSG